MTARTGNPTGRPPIDPRARFWTKAVADGTGCWPWRAGRIHGPKGARLYGRFKVHGKTILAHRYAYEFVKGPIPEGMCVLHKCDNPPCINPEHMFLGTLADNVADRDAKGRQAKGEGSGNVKLTEGDVRWIRAFRSQGASQQAIANALGVHQTLIGFVERGVAWKHVTY